MSYPYHILVQRYQDTTRTQATLTFWTEIEFCDRAMCPLAGTPLISHSRHQMQDPTCIPRSPQGEVSVLYGKSWVAETRFLPKRWCVLVREKTEGCLPHAALIKFENPHRISAVSRIDSTAISRSRHTKYCKAFLVRNQQGRDTGSSC